MQRDITIGLNRTGMQASPFEAGEMLKSMDLAPLPAELDRDDPRLMAAAGLRGEYGETAVPVGTVPPPMSLKAVVGTAKQALAGNHMHVLLDKLGERAAYERTGTRLYDAFLQ